ncbi:MAG: cytochrome c oxidase subunit II [Candidatus Promineofilum sp.]|nr:cytochrome c oxidase subunit II [Promineifilum sp.]
MHIDRYERLFIYAAVALLVVFMGALAVSSFAFGIRVPTAYEKVDPRTVATPPSPWGLPAEERLRELSPGNYEVYLLGQMWQFSPNTITVPAGSRVTFYVTSKDVQHGFKITNTNINIMALPGEVGVLTATFDEPGTYNFVCHEYCGALHHTMYGQIVVEE